MYRTYAIPEAFGGSCVRDFLRNGLHFPNRMISRLKVRQDGILLNGAHVTVRAVLSCADRLALSISDPVQYDPASRSVWHAPVPPAADAPVLYEDPDLLFFAKPAGAVMHPSHGHYADTMANAVASHLGIFRGRVYPIGRLDRDTTGVVCFAKHEDACSLLAEEQKKHIVQKTYLAEALGRIPCDGSVDRPIGIVESDLVIVRAFGEAPDASADADREACPSGSHITPRRAVMAEADGGQPAETIYRVRGWRMRDGSVLCAGKDTAVPVDTDVASTLLSVRIIHGRTHQIRVHMAYIGHPLAGDVLYGGAAVPDLHLHAYRMELLQPFTGERLSVTAPAPDWAAC